MAATSECATDYCSEGLSITVNTEASKRKFLLFSAAMLDLTSIKNLCLSLIKQRKSKLAPC